ncbi:MAG: NAD(P)H-hydrate dehydratase [Paracoccus denitrificans]|nr:MAG: NAD(P)H-hydrate dehydratase [Paracoccus denitrificans]PZO85158.1 MAG: NAD(P)H-hydrate dehydratase [Paracoccus denitrificans]
MADDRSNPTGAALGAWLRKEGMDDAHKYTHGAALVVAGPMGAGGAARLAARAALRVGTGIVTIGPPSAALIEHLGPPDALMRRAIAEAKDFSAAIADRRISALCIGPGCSIARSEALLPVVLGADIPAVLDADALTALSHAKPWPLRDGLVLTPHHGEFARLFPDLKDRGDQMAALTAARRSNAVVVLKGPQTVVAAPDGQTHVNDARDVPWLATAGSGDVLAGIVTGLLARGMSPLRAAIIATALHTRAARTHGPGLIADDLPEALPAVLRDWR